jgi:hypothetical protein
VFTLLKSDIQQSASCLNLSSIVITNETPHSSQIPNSTCFAQPACLQLVHLSVDGLIFLVLVFDRHILGLANWNAANWLNGSMLRKKKKLDFF